MKFGIGRGENEGPSAASSHSIYLERAERSSSKDEDAASFVDGIYEALGITHRMVANLSMRERGQMLRRLNNPFAPGRALRPSSAARLSPNDGVTIPGTLTYGEISAAEAMRIMAKAEPKQGEVFCDLGSGRGQVVLAMRARWAHVLKECRGIEALPGLVELSKRAAETMGSAEDAGNVPSSTAAGVSFTVADFLKDDHLWMDADIIYMVGTCFPPDWFDANGAIGMRIPKLKLGTRICIVTQTFEGLHGIRCIGCIRDLKATWGNCLARVYERWSEDDDSDF